MELILKRKYFNDDYTIGKLYNGLQYICDTLEPSTHGLVLKTWSGPKVKLAKERYGSVAIPPGSYPLLITKCPELGKWLPQLVGVRGFKRVRIRAGNAPSDTRCSILPGFNRQRGRVMESTTCVDTIMRLLADCFAEGGTARMTVK